MLCVVFGERELSQPAGGGNHAAVCTGIYIRYLCLSGAIALTLHPNGVVAGAVAKPLVTFRSPLCFSTSCRRSRGRTTARQRYD